jgi:predicted TIM-barrel fold metal-dependent hydrolase
MFIDFHAHCFPPHVARKALPVLAKRSGAFKPYTDGTPDGLSDALRHVGVAAAVVQNIATTPKQQRAVNDFAISLLDVQGLIPFGSVHPDAPDAFAELTRLRDAGIRGIKLHPDYQVFFAGEKRLFPLYEKIAALGLVTLFHAGVDIGLPDPVHADPAQLALALPAFGGAPVVAAHMGGYMCTKAVLETLAGKEIYFDTSYSARKLPPEWAKQLIAAHGADKILFGSDSPWSALEEEIAYVRDLDLCAEDTAAILGGNAAKLLCLANDPAQDIL